MRFTEVLEQSQQLERAPRAHLEQGTGTALLQLVLLGPEAGTELLRDGAQAGKGLRMRVEGSEFTL